MNLLTVNINAIVRIIAIEGGQGLQVKLNRYGLFPGDVVRVLKVAPLGGPVLLDAGGREIALGRGIAARVRVETV